MIHKQTVAVALLGVLFAQATLGDEFRIGAQAGLPAWTFDVGVAALGQSTSVEPDAEPSFGVVGQYILGSGGGDDGNFYVGDTVWHPDMGWDPHIPEGQSDPNKNVGAWRYHYHPSIKVAFYLDPVGKDTGCLRVIPGAHRNPYHDRLWSLHLNVPSAASKEDPHKFENVRPKLLEMWEQATGDKEGAEQFLSDPDINHFGVAPCDIPAYPIESEPGDAVFFSHQLWHASFGGRVGRRMFTLNFRSAEIDTDE